MNNKILLVTGASSDIALELIKNSHDEYDKIIAHYNRNSEKLNELKEIIGDKLIPLQADFNNDNEVQSFIDTIKENYGIPTHIVHLPAQRVKVQKFKNIHWDEFQQDINIQMKSIVIILNEFLPAMAKQKYGKVVFMLSSVTVGVPPKFWTEYVTIKYAMLGLMKALTSEYVDKHININAVSPSMIETKFLENVPELMVQQTAQANPMKRNAEVKDIIPALEYLLSDNAGYVFGENIVIAGGSTF